MSQCRENHSQNIPLLITRYISIKREVSTPLRRKAAKLVLLKDVSKLINACQISPSFRFYSCLIVFKAVPGLICRLLPKRRRYPLFSLGEYLIVFILHFSF